MIPGSMPSVICDLFTWVRVCYEIFPTYKECDKRGLASPSSLLFREGERAFRRVDSGFLSSCLLLILFREYPARTSFTKDVEQ
jgi:hypothetical protein